MDLALAYITLYTTIFIFGMIIGSFLNVCIYRLPKDESIIKSSSHCMKCGEKIKRYDLIPIFSWIILKGKCRNCGDKISPRYPIVEALNAFGYLSVFMAIGIETTIDSWHSLVNAIILCIFFSMLIVVAFIDWDTQEMNVSILLMIALLAVPSIFLADTYSLKERLIGAVVISIPFLIIALITGGMGMGDVILMAGAGLLIGTKAIIVAAFLGIVLGAIVGIIIKSVTKKSQIAFGPYLAAALAFSSLYGDNLANWYINTFFLK